MSGQARRWIGGRRRVRARGLHVGDLCFEAAAGPSQLSPLCAKIGHARIADEDDHRDHADADQQRHRAERTLGAVVGPGSAQALEHAVSA